MFHKIEDKFLFMIFPFVFHDEVSIKPLSTWNLGLNFKEPIFIVLFRYPPSSDKEDPLSPSQLLPITPVLSDLHIQKTWLDLQSWVLKPRGCDSWLLLSASPWPSKHTSTFLESIIAATPNLFSTQIHTMMSTFKIFSYEHPKVTLQFLPLHSTRPFPDSGEQIKVQRGVIIIEFWVLYDISLILQFHNYL